MAAKHRSLVQDQIADVTECSICTEIFTNPKVLPCVHTFCLHCLESYGKDKKPGDQMVCPICRKEFLIPHGGFSQLPSNFFIGKVVEIGKLAMTPAAKSLCALCPEGGEVLAQLFCVDCEQNLCRNCANIHKKSRCSQNHQVVELGSQLNSSEINLRSSYCDHHPGEQIKMFCYEDNVAICLICCVESHKSHRCVNVNKAAVEFVEQLKNSMRNVTDRLPECEEVAQKLEIFKQEFEEEVFKAEDGIREATTQLKKLIDQHTEILVQNLKLLREQNLKAFEITKQDVDRFKVMIDSFSRYSEELLARGSPVDVCRAVNQMLTRARELETLPANCSGDCFRCDSVSFQCSNIVEFLGEYGKNIAVGELTVTQSSHRFMKFRKETSGKLEESFQGESPVADRCVIEVQGIPDTATDAIVHMIFENKRYTGIADVELGQSEMLEGGRALLTIKEQRHAKALIDRGSITYKNHTLVISRPSKPAPVEEVKESAQRPFSYKHLNETPAAKLLTQLESLVFEGSKLVVTKHIDEDRSQKYFPPRKRNNDPTRLSEKEQPSISDRTIKVSNIPSDANKETLEMVFESRRYGGGEFDDIVYDQRKGIAVITFEDPEVAKTLLQMEVIVYKGNRLTITKPVQEPIECEKQEQASSVSSRMVDVSEIPYYMMTKEILMMLLKNSSGGEIESIDYNQHQNIAVATFTDSVAADILISVGSVVYRRKRLPIARHVEKVDDKKHILKEKKEQPASSNRSIFVSKIPRKLNKDYLVMIFEMKRNGGGKIEDVVYDEEKGTAVITFEDSNVAESFRERKIVEFKGQRMLITKH